MDSETETQAEVLEGEVAPSAEPAPIEMPPAPTQEVALEPLQGAPADMSMPEDLTLVLDVPVELAVEMGRTTMTIRETLAIGTGSIITLNRLVGEPVDLFANGRLIARVEVIAIDEEYGLRVTEVLAHAAKAA